jgi:hypothetical protein
VQHRKYIVGLFRDFVAPALDRMPGSVGVYPEMQRRAKTGAIPERSTIQIHCENGGRSQ